MVTTIIIEKEFVILPMNWHWTSIDSIESLSQTELDELQDPCQQTSPFLSKSFLGALESSKSVGETSGWFPQHIIVRDNHHKLIAFLPAYIKAHSYGEYVFDHSWANAYQQHGLDYYPKLIIAIPFTPVTGPRILLSPDVSGEQICQYISTIQHKLMETLNVSSMHFLFANQHVSTQLAKHGFSQRQSVQFNWRNNNYTQLSDFTDELTARRRRSIRKERAGVAKQGVVVKRLNGAEISSSDMAFFYACYQQTYLKRSGHNGYLTLEFFDRLLRDMPHNLLLVIAEQLSEPIASALFLHDKNGLYGRYWGAHIDVSGLHFEACYYQGIEFCIEQNIPLFNPGTQGEHKILRGFAPTMCYSNHKMREPAFDNAVIEFLQRETPHIIDYAKKSASLLPFKEPTAEP